MSRSHTSAPQPKGEFQQDYVWKIAQAVREMLRGKTNNIGDITLRASQTTTVLKDPLIGPESHFDFTPLTANARTALNSLYVTDRIAGQATLNHPSSADTDQTFTYVVTG